MLDFWGAPVRGDPGNAGMSPSTHRASNTLPLPPPSQLMAKMAKYSDAARIQFKPRSWLPWA